MKIIPAAVVASLAWLIAAPIYAQGPYVAASIGADVARFSSSDDFDNPATGEAFSWALRLGGPIGSSFGAELEFARPEDIERDQTPDVRILSALLGGPVNPAAPNVGVTIFPPINFSVETSRRNTTLTASVWARQEVSPRFSIVYLGGIAFNRIEQRYEYSFGNSPRVNPLPTILPRGMRMTTYGAGPMAGVEGRISMSDHARLVPGVRLHAFDGGWLIRPAVGLAWEF